MSSILYAFPASITPKLGRLKIDCSTVIGLTIRPIGGLRSNVQLPISSKCQIEFTRISRIPSISSNGQSIGEGDLEEEAVDELRVPNHWLDDPSKALEESEWLRVTLHKWLDDEYCPEPTNVKISQIASNSLYKSLMEKRTDIGEILLEMARELESISYQESFHGAFSSANAAINLIIQRIQQD